MSLLPNSVKYTNYRYNLKEQLYVKKELNKKKNKLRNDRLVAKLILN